jgi:hypothetical protein
MVRSDRCGRAAISRFRSPSAASRTMSCCCAVSRANAELEMLPRWCRWLSARPARSPARTRAPSRWACSSACRSSGSASVNRRSLRSWRSGGEHAATEMSAPRRSARPGQSRRPRRVHRRPPATTRPSRPPGRAVPVRSSSGRRIRLHRDDHRRPPRSAVTSGKATARPGDRRHVRPPAPAVPRQLLKNSRRSLPSSCW